MRIKMTMQMKLNVETTAYLKKMTKVLTVQLTKRDVNNYLMKKCCVRLVKISPDKDMATNYKMTKTMTENVNKQEVTNYLQKMKTKVNIQLNKKDINTMMKNCFVKLVKISPTILSPAMPKDILCCTIGFLFLPAGGSVWALDCGHLFCGGCMQGLQGASFFCRVCGGRGSGCSTLKIFLQ